MELKNLHPSNECQIIRRQHRHVQQEMNTQIDIRDEAQDRIQRLNEEYFAADSVNERHRISEIQGQALADLERALQTIEFLRREMRDLENNYFLSGCDELLGGL